MSEMPINGENLAKLEQLCHSSIEAGIKRLCEVGTWPRPPAARRLRVGYDFYGDDLRGIQETNNLIELLASYEELRSIYCTDPSKPESWIFHDFWERLLLNILTETEGMSPSNRVFQKWFRRFIKELYTDIAVWRTVDTMTGLVLHGKEFNFDKFTTLTSIPGYDLGRIIWGHKQYFRHDEFIRDQWLTVGGLDKATIITTVRIPKCQYAGFYWPMPHLLRETERPLAVLDAIRLSKPGSPNLHCHAKFHMSYFPLADPVGHCDYASTAGVYEKETILEISDFRSIRNLWKELMDTRYKEPWPRHYKFNAMDAALGRFFMSYKLQNWLENMVDLTIALESLFGPEDNQELSHRIALRCTWLLSIDEDVTNNRIYNRVRTMYDIRSSVVHGRMPKESKIRKWVQTLSGIKYDESRNWELRELAVESARDIVRKAIKACKELSKLDVNGPHWPFPKDFDKNLVIAGQRRVWQKAAGIKK